ncbi:MAG TPA: hypothetical protein VGR30_05020 [Candidatus Binatia bacterium]|jgi:hypothetical protein|nr:hypothetical protein [Candidatus Binatia bacterium]
MTMSLRIRFNENKLKQSLYQTEDDFVPEVSGAGWPKNTWFQERLRHVREQQRKKMGEPDFVYECPLGTITLRHSNGGD